MGPHIYVLGLSLSLRLNSEQLINIIAGLSLSCRSNSEKRTKFKTRRQGAFPWDVLVYELLPKVDQDE